MIALATELLDRYDIVLAYPPSSGGRRLLEGAARNGIRSKLLDDEESTTAWLAGEALDLVHIHAGVGWEGHGLSSAARAAGVPRIVRTEHLPDVITAPAQRLAHTDGVARVDRIICVSEAAASSFRSAGVDRGKIAVIRNGLRPRSPVRHRAEVRAELRLRPDQPLVLTAARFTPQKNQVTLIEAMPAVLAVHPDLCWALAGAGPLLDACRQRAESLGVAASVLFLGDRDDIADLLGAADLFVLPSRFEGLPLAVLEAMSAGLAVVATFVGGTNEAVLDGITGRLVPPGDAVALARAVCELVGDRRRAAAMGAAGAKRFGEDFTAARMASDTARLYDSLGAAPGAESGRSR